MRIGSRTVKNKKKSKKPVVKASTLKEAYQKYLNSKEWKKKRDKFKELKGGKCEVCGSTENLHVHHLNYDCLGKETINDLACLCKGCHLSAHRGRLKIWVFSKEEMKHFDKIQHIVCDSPNVTYYARLQREDVRLD